MTTKIVFKTQTKCDHDPEHDVWISRDGPISVCKMKPHHLTNAIRMMIKSIRYIYENGTVGFWDFEEDLLACSPTNIDLWIAEDRLQMLLKERNRRIRLGIYRDPAA